MPGTSNGLTLRCLVDDFLWPWDSPTPVVMMHGYARSAAFWNRWIPPVASRHRVYRPELPGCGGAEAPPPGYEFTPETIARYLLDVFDAHSLGRVHWVGESSGGIIGLLLAALHPERIASVIACNAPTRIPPEIKKIYALGEESSAAAILRHGVGGWCRQTLRYRLDVARASPELQDWYVAEMDRTSPQVAVSLIECFEAVDLAPLLERIATPVLLLSGDGSKIASEQQDQLARSLPNGRLKLFEGYGHGINLLQPERCAQEALHFWGST